VKNKLANMHKIAMKIIGRREYEPVQILYDQTVMKHATKIKSDPQHPLFPEFETLPSGRRLRVPKCKTNRLK